MMNSEIIIERLAADADGRVFKVSVIEGGERSDYVVSLTEEFFGKIGKGRSAEDLVKKSFEFLLEREPKELILKSFDISDISDHFPEFDREISE